MADAATRLAQDRSTAAMTSRAQQAQAILGSSPLGDWIRKYNCGMPASFAATIVLFESGGNFGAPGDASLGEVGFFQIAEYVPAEFGLPAEARLDPESNVCIGQLEYALEAIVWKMTLPDLVMLGSADAWKLARLSFAIGRGGAQGIARMAGVHTQGGVYDDIVDFVSRNGAPALGSQSADVVTYRVLTIPIQWDIGRLVGSDLIGPPMLPPDPPAGPIVIAPDIAQFFSRPLPSILLILGGLGILGYALWRRRNR